jgi:secreted Zn-dependent insulinase-like peptidase
MWKSRVKTLYFLKREEMEKTLKPLLRKKQKLGYKMMLKLRHTTTREYETNDGQSGRD